MTSPTVEIIKLTDLSYTVNVKNISYQTANKIMELVFNQAEVEKKVSLIQEDDINSYMKKTLQQQKTQGSFFADDLDTDIKTTSVSQFKSSPASTSFVSIPTPSSAPAFNVSSMESSATKNAITATNTTRYVPPHLNDMDLFDDSSALDALISDQLLYTKNQAEEDATSILNFNKS